jgi:hypothetical protein
LANFGGVSGYSGTRGSRSIGRGIQRVTRIDKTLIVLSEQEVKRIASVVAREDSIEALRVMKEVLAKRIELILKKRCK